MKQHDYILFSGIIFLLVFVLQGLRIIFGWEAVIGGWEVPLWISWIAVAVSGYLLFSALKLGGYLK